MRYMVILLIIVIVTIFLIGYQYGMENERKKYLIVKEEPDTYIYDTWNDIPNQQEELTKFANQMRKCYKQ